MKVLVIPEDPTLDQYVLKPIIERMLADHGLKARVDALRDPHLRGVAQALDSTIVAEIIRDNPMQDLFVLMVDRDCDRLGNSTKAAARVAEHEGRLLACLAHQEVEVWMLALHRTEPLLRCSSRGGRGARHGLRGRLRTSRCRGPSPSS
ncbi:MAG: hypothetical protein AB1Z98_02070, partial [Nannocystaceae bacterium]